MLTENAEPDSPSGRCDCNPWRRRCARYDNNTEFLWRGANIGDHERARRRPAPQRKVCHHAPTYLFGVKTKGRTTYLRPCSRKPIIAAVVLVIALAVYLPYFSIGDIISTY